MAKVDWLEAPATCAARRVKGSVDAMKIRAQIAMVLNLDKCIGCHTCSRHLQERLDQPRGRGIRVVQQRRDQARHRLSQGVGEPGAAGTAAGCASAQRRASSRAWAASWRVLAKIFANPDLPQIDDYYEPLHLRLRASAECAARCRRYRPRGRAR
jgi:nitrate reductase beta subunit